MKVQKISQLLTPFAGISFVNQEFNESGLSVLFDNHLGIRPLKTTGYSFRGHNKPNRKIIPWRPIEINHQSDE